MARAETAEALAVVVAYSPQAGQVDEVSLSLPAGATVADAVQASGLMLRHPTLNLASLRVGVWGKLRQPAEGLREGDRVEIYRPLTVDPKEARRLRYRQHRERYATK